MKKLVNLNSPADYVALLGRRKTWVLVPFLVLASAIGVLTYMLPKAYVSDALILIRPRDVPEDFVKDLIAGTTEQRLAAIEQTVLSRTILIQILQEFEDDLPEYKRLNMDEKVVKLKKQIKVDFESESRGSVQLPVTYFRISYQNRSPELAQKIAAKVTALFIDQDNKARESQVFGTTEFLAGELAKIADQLQQSESKLKELRTSRRYELPDQLETNLRTLDRLGLQKQANAEALDRQETIRLNLERQIAETQPTLPQQLQAAALPQPKSPLVEEYKRKRLEFDELKAKYTDQHPDILARKVQLERLKEKIPAAELENLDKETTEAAKPAPAPVPNPVYQNLVASLQQVKTELELREKERKLVQESIAVYTQRVQNAPQSEQEIADILRQNTDLTKQYDKLKNDLAQAKLSESLESRQKGSQFVIVDPANYPLLPTKPAKAAIAIGGIVFSLVIGIVIAVVADIASQRIWTQSDIEAVLGVPILAEIPEIVTAGDVEVSRKKRVAFIASSVAFAAIYGLCLYVFYLKQGFVLRHLDSVLEKLY